FANPLGVDPGDDQPAAAVFFDQLLLLEQLQRVADWLPRYAKGAAQLLLADALPGGERAVGNRLDQLLIGAVDQCRLGVEMLDPGTAAYEFRIPIETDRPAQVKGLDPPRRCAHDSKLVVEDLAIKSWRRRRYFP